jgi:DNA-directed RNA polymerase subunit H
LLKKDLEKIARAENITTKGTKKELVKRLGKKLRLKVIRKYYSGLTVKRRIGIFKHSLVPLHRIMDDGEVEKLKKKYGLKSLKQLPRILITDPAAIAIGAARGDVLEITRNNKIVGESKYYRLVI